MNRAELVTRSQSIGMLSERVALELQCLRPEAEVAKAKQAKMSGADIWI